MENNMQIFQNEKFGKIRTLNLDGEPWFVAADVCKALEIGNPTDATRRLDADELTLVSIEGTNNGLPVNAVNEPGLYTLILGSRKPEAKAFKRWITHEVIPAIRKHGAYTSPNAEAVQVTPTIEQYIASARIIATCRADRLQMVIGLLDKAGISIPMNTSTNSKVERVNTAELQTNM